ncbi:MAG TPA: biotin--[acetyl-CoA-carboxylase] ligase [Pseudomonadota bacterium]|nr:biotin--[acetyl-CoA-carboxylase] ligase [Pseudomonadota bacterium]
MTASSLGSSWLHLPHCESTNDELIRLGRAGAAHGSVVTADAQGRGRGRQGRAWFSPPGDNLYLSVLLRPPLPPHRAPPLCLAAGLALFDAVSALLQEAGVGSAIDLRLKWPNDLLAAPRLASAATEYRKLGGILTELFGLSGSIDFVVIGIGCNVRTRDFPVGVPATSLACLLPPSAVDGRPPLSPRLVAERFLASLFHWYERYLQSGPAPITEAFSAYASLGPSHPPVEVKLRPDEPSLRGIPIALGPDGELLLQTAAGIERVLSGDVVMAPLLPTAAPR